MQDKSVSFDRHRIGRVGLVEDIHQGGEALHLPVLHQVPVLADGEVGKLRGLAVPVEADGLKVPVLYPLAEGEDSLPEGSFLGFRQLIDPLAAVPRRLEDQLPGNERRKGWRRRERCGSPPRPLP